MPASSGDIRSSVWRSRLNGFRIAKNMMDEGGNLLRASTASCSHLVCRFGDYTSSSGRTFTCSFNTITLTIASSSTLPLCIDVYLSCVPSASQTDVHLWQVSLDVCFLFAHRTSNWFRNSLTLQLLLE